MTTRDPRDRRRRYDGAVQRRQFARWMIRGIRFFAVPTGILSLLLAVDLVLPPTSEVGLAYRRTSDTRWLIPDGSTVGIGWPDRSNCLEERDSGRRFLFTTRPGCSGTVSVSANFGRRIAGGDSLRVVRTPLFHQVRAVYRPADNRGDQWYPLLNLGLFIVLGLVPLLSFGRNYGVYDTTGAVSRYHIAYLIPALVAEAFYVWLLVQVLSGG